MRALLFLQPVAKYVVRYFDGDVNEKTPESDMYVRLRGRLLVLASEVRGT